MYLAGKAMWDKIQIKTVGLVEAAFRNNGPWYPADQDWSWRLDNMAQGTVKWFNTQKGYGFINPDEEGNDVFVHITAVQNSGLNGLNEGQKVTYDLEEQRNGKMAAVGLAVID